jgi:lipoyl(octanoyl) transferase
MSMVQQQLVAAFERNLQVTCHVCHYQPTIGGDEHDYDRGKKTGIIS